VQGKAIVLEAKEWIRSWMDGSCCYTKEEYEFSKAQLFHKIQTCDCVTQCLGSNAVSQLVKWIVDCIIVHELYYVFYRKKDVRCFDEYCTNLAEGMNTAAKKSSISAKPNKSMAVSTDHMTNHSQLMESDQKAHLKRAHVSTPLWINPEMSECLAVLSELTPLAKSMVLNQHKERQNYVYVRLDSTTFIAVRKSVKPTTRVHLPVSFRGRPQFCRAHRIKVEIFHPGMTALLCSCGYQNRYGIPCRHVFGLEPTCCLADISCRWQLRYALYAHSDKKMTEIFKKIKASEYKGLLVKNGDLLQRGHDKWPCRILMPWEESGETDTSIEDTNFKRVMDIHHSSVPVCWNYPTSEYPPRYCSEDTPTEALGHFSQEYTVQPDGDQEELSSSLNDQSSLHLHRCLHT